MHGRKEKCIPERYRKKKNYIIYTNIVLIVRQQAVRHRFLTVKSWVQSKCYTHFIYVLKLEFTRHHKIHTQLSYMRSTYPTNWHVVTTRIQLALASWSTLLCKLKLTNVWELVLLIAKIGSLFETDVQKRRVYVSVRTIHWETKSNLKYSEFLIRTSTLELL